MGLFETLMGTGTTQTSNVKLSQMGSLERLGANLTEEELKQLKDLVSKGAGSQDVTNSLNSQRDLATLLQSYSQGGFLPTAQDTSTAQQYAKDIFAPQQTSLNQLFASQQTDANRQAAMLGRDINDPILRNKLAQSQANEQGILIAQQTALSAQTAQNMPLQRLGFASDLANVNQSLANQAFQNRQTLLNLGNTVQQQGQNFRLNTATRTSNTNTDTGLVGLAGGISGLIGGGIGISNGLSTLFNSFNQPAAAAQPNYSAGVYSGGSTLGGPSRFTGGY